MIGEPPHLSYNNIIYFPIHFGPFMWRQSLEPSPSVQSPFSLGTDEDTFRGRHLSELEHLTQGVWKYDIRSPHQQPSLVVSMSDIVTAMGDSVSGVDSNSVEISHVEPSLDNNKISLLYNHTGGGTNVQVVMNADGTDISRMSYRPFHALWFDAKSMMGARPVVARYDLSGNWLENLGGTAAHEGASSDREWYAGEEAPDGAYEMMPDTGMRIRLYKRGQITPVATLSKWYSQITWDAVAHANPAFSADGNRLYFVRGHTDPSEPMFNLHYVDLKAYKGTLSRYCGAGEPYYEHRVPQDERYITKISVKNVTQDKFVVPEHLLQNKYPSHGYDFLSFGGAENTVALDDRVKVSIEASDKSRWSRIKAAVDWNQSGTFWSETEEVFTKGAADAENSGILSFNKNFTVPSNAMAGDTMMRIRFYEAEWSFPGYCGSKERTTTYDVPIRVALTFSNDNACRDADLIEANEDDEDADNVFDDYGSTSWSAKGSFSWVKKCFSEPRTVQGVRLDYDGTGRNYKFDIEILDSASHGWVKALENRRSLGVSGASAEKHFFPSQFGTINAAAIRYVGYGSITNPWNNLWGMEVISGTGTTKVANVVDDAYVGVGESSNRGSDVALLVHQDITDDGVVLTNQNAFLKFRLPKLSGSVDRATFRIKVRYQGGSVNSLHLVPDNDWSEGSITGLNLPSETDLSFINSVPVPGQDQWLEVDVTSEFNSALNDASRGKLTLRLSAPHNSGSASSNGVTSAAMYHSSDASNVLDRPQLVYVRVVD